MVLPGFFYFFKLNSTRVIMHLGVLGVVIAFTTFCCVLGAYNLQMQLPGAAVESNLMKVCWCMHVHACVCSVPMCVQCACVCMCVHVCAVCMYVCSVHVCVCSVPMCVQCACMCVQCAYV